MYIGLYKIPNKALSCLDPTSPVCVCVGGGRTPIQKSDEDTRRKIKIKPLRETNVGVAEA